MTDPSLGHCWLVSSEAFYSPQKVGTGGPAGSAWKVSEVWVGGSRKRSLLLIKWETTCFSSQTRASVEVGKTSERNHTQVRWAPRGKAMDREAEGKWTSLAAKWAWGKEGREKAQVMIFPRLCCHPCEHLLRWELHALRLATQSSWPGSSTSWLSPPLHATYLIFAWCLLCSGMIETLACMMVTKEWNRNYFHVSLL